MIIYLLSFIVEWYMVDICLYLIISSLDIINSIDLQMIHLTFNHGIDLL